MEFKLKVGNAIDIHKIEKVDQATFINLGGCKLNSNYRVMAHSDGDVILHAISNAILNAIGLDDIGTYFPDTDEKYKSLDSKIILSFALDKLRNYNYKIGNISIVLNSDFIFLKPNKKYILHSLQKLTDNANISIHGTRTEQNLNIISAYVTILIIKE